MLDGDVYSLVQFHFHAPSEHTLNGRHYPMEMHLVHKSDSGRLAVIGVFIEEGEHHEAFDAVCTSATNRGIRVTGSELVGLIPLKAMVEAAAAQGYSYLAITDHGEDLTINGASPRQMLAQRKQLAKVQEECPEMRLLHGCELNIGKDGSVDYDLDVQLGFDWTVASVHSFFDLDRNQQTERVIQAMANPAVSAIGHLTGRYIGRRPGIELDLEAVMKAAAATGTAIEINGALQRLDATPEAIRIGIDHGVTFVIDTDSHHPSELGRMEYGVLNAQRGWVEKAIVANTWPTTPRPVSRRKRCHVFGCSPTIHWPSR